MYEKALTTFLQLAAETWVVSASQADNTLYYAILSLFLHSLEEWKETKLSFLKRTLINAFVESSGPSSSSSSSSSSVSSPPPAGAAPASNFKIVRPYLIYFALIDKMQSLFKKASGVPATAQTAVVVSHKAEETWIEEMKKNIRVNGDSAVMVTNRIADVRERTI